jgi:hypothetical protein
MDYLAELTQACFEDGIADPFRSQNRLSLLARIFRQLLAPILIEAASQTL